MYRIIVFLVFLFWTGLHIYFFKTKDILTVADSFAYLQMAHSFSNFSLLWFWTWWFWFLYSFFIAITNLIVTYFDIKTVDSLILSAHITNIILFNISWILLYFIWKIYLNKNYNLMLIILFFISPTLIDYNVNILSENIYIPLFLALYLLIDKFIYFISWYTDGTSIKWLHFEFKDDAWLYNLIVWISFILSLLYFTRGEAFIYIWSIFFILLILLLKKDVSFFKFLKYNFLIIILFFLFISPYIYYLHTITWERWITNKWDSNLRQAQMRWIQSMDDAWFEKAVWELTSDKHHFIHWFAWWLKYDKSTSTWTLLQYIWNNPNEFLSRFYENQKKLYLRTLPELVIWESLKTYNDKSSFFYKNKFYLWFLFLPLFLFLYGLILLFFSDEVFKSEKKNFKIITFTTFFTASLFFTIFFVLPRYFIIFLPIILVAICYWTEKFLSILEDGLEWNETLRAFKYLIFLFLFSLIFWVGNLNYFTYSEIGQSNYSLKKDSWLELKEKYMYTLNDKVLILKEDLNIKQWIWKINTNSSKIDTTNLKVMERFPILTYYIWSKQRWLTPYTNKLEDLLEYAKFNKIDYLVVDTMDFEKYRPDLVFLLDYNKKHKWLEFVRKFAMPWNLVVIYRFKNQKK